MKPTISPPSIGRRNFLRGLGVTLALPWLESLGGRLFAAEPGLEPRRLLLISLPLGIYRDAFVPTSTGSSYEATEYLKVIEAFRDRTTIISGLDHPGIHGGHAAQSRIFTGRPSEKRNACSLDQYLASHIGKNNRFDSLVLSAGANDFSWTEGGTMVPPEKSASEAFAKLFADSGTDSKEKVIGDLVRGRSIMDFVMGEAKALQPQLSATDRDKLDEFFESVRATELRLAKSEEWLGTPKPKLPGVKPLTDPANPAEIITSMRNVCDLTYLAFKTDSTRIITFGYFRQDQVDVPGVDVGYHNLSHHGMEENNITKLKLVERAFFEELNRLLTNLANASEGDASLLDRTTILVTSNLGNGSSHSNKDLPVLLAGGRFKHGQHLAYERSTVPLSNLFVSLLNQFGLPDRSFGTSTGPLRGLSFS